MHWQVDLIGVAEPAAWMAREYVPDQPEPRAPPDAPRPEARSVFDRRDQLFVGMTEAMLRLIVQYPGLVDKVAETIQLQPGQSRKTHFDTMMEAISRAARFHPGLGLAIDAALEPFSGDDLWQA